MSRTTSLGSASLILGSLVLGIVAGGLLARVSDQWWWQVMPWVLLVGFWIMLVRRFRPGNGQERVTGHNGSTV